MKRQQAIFMEEKDVPIFFPNPSLVCLIIVILPFSFPSLVVWLLNISSYLSKCKGGGKTGNKGMDIHKKMGSS